MANLPDHLAQWEYTAVKATFANDLHRMSNELGSCGWEAVSVSVANGVISWTGNKMFALFKRPVATDQAVLLQRQGVDLQRETVELLRRAVAQQ